MLLYLIRHGKAEKKSATGRDEDRPLQPRGERQSRWLGETLAGADASERPGLILTSPAVRACETARIIREFLQCPLRIDPGLALGHPVENVMEGIRRAARSDPEFGPAPLMLIGHNPQLEILLPALVPGLTAEESEMRTGEAALLRIDIGAHDLEGGAKLIRRMRYAD